MRPPCLLAPRRRYPRLARQACLAVSCVVAVASPAMGQNPPPPAASTPWYQDLTFNAFLSASYSVNLNRPASATNQFRVFDFDDASLKIDVEVLRELTFTPEFRVHPKFIVHGEVRDDWSDAAVFESHAGGTTFRQTTVAINTMFVF